MGYKTVKQGDCVSSIAAAAGFTWQTLWHHPENAKLKALRTDPNVLYPGDRIFVPDIAPKGVNAGSDATHTFKLPDVPIKMKVRLMVDDEPRTSGEYRLTVDGVELASGSVGGDGTVEAKIPPNSAKGELVVTNEDGNSEHYQLQLGALDPIDTESGVVSRLFNLGYDTSDLDTAVKEFRQWAQLGDDSVLDDQTRTKLKDTFGQ